MLALLAVLARMRTFRDEGDACAAAGVPRATFRRYLARFVAGGSAALTDKPRKKA